MARDHEQNGGGDHDSRGRFAAGNKAGKGNPHHRRVAELRAKMLERVTPDDLSAVVEALVNKAKAGDMAAIKPLRDRVFGRIADHDAAAAEDRAESDAQRRERERERTEREADLHKAESVIEEAEQRRMLEVRASLAGVELR
jgi:hypothetical protein